MFPEERRKIIKEILLKDKKVIVSELAKNLDVSEETVRRDLTALEKQGFLEKSYGGAVLKEEFSNQPDTIADISERKTTNLQSKDRIAAQAAKLVHENQAILLDAGSTTVRMIPYLLHLKKLTIITTSIDIAMETSPMVNNWEILVIGGRLYKSFNLIGPGTSVELKNYSVDLAFMGASGIVINSGFTCSDIYEAEAKETMLSIAKEKIFLIDETKFYHKGLRVFAPFHQANILITSSKAPEDELNKLRKLIPQIILCDAAG